MKKTPPHRLFRLEDGRTLDWGGETWQGYWRYGDAVYAAAPVDDYDRGRPLGENGQKLDGGFVACPSAKGGPPSYAVPSKAQYTLLYDMPNSESGVRNYNGNQRRTLAALDKAGWVYWSGPAGWAYLHTTAAGRSAVLRYKEELIRKKNRKQHAKRQAARVAARQGRVEGGA